MTARCLVPVVIGLISALSAKSVAEVTPHSSRSDRWVDKRGEYSVEYSAGQEAWVERVFARLEAINATIDHPEPLPTPQPAPLSVSNIEARKPELLEAISHQIGLTSPTDLQERTFETFLGYYEILTEVFQEAALVAWDHLRLRHLAIWHREELTELLRRGEEIAGFNYDLKTDKGNYRLETHFTPEERQQRIDEIYREIEQLRVNHSFDYSDEGFTAGVSFGKGRQENNVVSPESPKREAIVSDLPTHVVPVFYDGDFDREPDEKFIDRTFEIMQAARLQLVSEMQSHQDPTIVRIIIHETTEIGLIENRIRSKDRRWLCDGTADYTSWRVVRDLFGPDKASQVFDLNSELRRSARWQDEVSLKRWSPTSGLNDEGEESELNRAHYAFAARAMFMIAERYGEDALALLWRDMADDGVDKASVRAFARAFKRRYDGNLNKLIREAEKAPITQVSRLP